MFRYLVLSSFAIVFINGFSFSASIEKAILLSEHGLTIDAKRELIDVIFEKRSKASDKAQSYYLLGNIAFGEDRIKVALNSWKHLVDKYPKSEEAGLVKNRIAELSEIVVGSAKEDLDNAVARSYLRHADFWSKGKSDIFKIDSSWISNVDASLKWYDKVITEFPKSKAARIAYEDKLRTLLGWETGYGEDRESYGIKKDFLAHIDPLTTTFNNFESDFPEALSLQAFRFQIAQAFFIEAIIGRGRNYAKSRSIYLNQAETWLNAIIDKAGEKDSFYRDLAERRKVGIAVLLDNSK
ncbi:MAG: hypothetical protein OXU27_01385 [Candidatus Poribacteria bacterium]|nr:hypothetical protein [Candidatus Poribacteria bacterium]